MHDIFFFTDVHGMYDLYRAAINYCQEQDPEAIIIYGGDACDRGPDGYRIMKELLANPYIIYLKGNHEDMFVQAAQEIHKDYQGNATRQQIEDYLYVRLYECVPIYNVVNNGGWSTLCDWMLDGAPMDFVEHIGSLPLTLQYGYMDFCHAGGDPKVYTRVVKNEHDPSLIGTKDAEMMLWDRNWLGFGWIPERICIFGHTPTPYLPAKYYGLDKATARAHPCKYLGTIDDRLTGYKIDMDTCAHASGNLYVLNCLTMKAQGFHDIDIENEIDKHQIEKIEVIQF